MAFASRIAAAALIAFAFTAAAQSPKETEPPRNEKLHALFDREFMRTVDEFPEFGTFLGMDGYDDRLSDGSPQAVAQRKKHTPEVIAELKAFDPAKLSTQDRLSRAMLLEQLERARAFDELYGDLPFGSNDSWLVLSPMFGPEHLYSLLAKAARFRTARDYENYIKRLEAIPRAIDERIETGRAGIRSGWMPPREAMIRVPGKLEAYAGADVKATPLWHPFESFPAGVPEAERAALVERGRRVLAERVHPAFAKLKKFAETEYLPGSRATFAASDLPAGKRYYELLVRGSTTTTLTADEIHAIGLAEVKRIRAEMEALIASTGFKGTWDEFMEFTRTDKRFFFDKPEARLVAYRDIAKRVDAELPKLFAELPRLPYGVRAMDESEGDNFDHYSNGAIDGSRAGFFDANVNNLSKRPSHEMESTFLHEAVPGHHLQVARAQEIHGLPMFRRVGGYSAYSEGWALYAESLGKDVGLYTDPYQLFGRLSAEMLRACRLVVDTGLHTGSVGREQAIKYMVDNSGYHPDSIATEVDRYMVNPAQALGYKVGELKIKALRAKAKAALGDKFDVRRFHNAILDDGALPLTVLEARIDEWIAKEKENK
jgi:uncharacterized protein (DUF885 family)